MSFWEQLAVDKFNALFYEKLISSAERAIRKAVANLQSVLVGKRESIIEGVSVNRRNSPLLNPRLNVIRIDNLNRKYYITCKRPMDLITLKTKEAAIAILPYEEERYFFKSFLHIECNYLLFRRDSDMYHLKRRENKRLKIPASFAAFLMIKKQNHNLTFLKAVILDFSDTGCKVALNTESPIFKKGDELIGTLRIGNKNGVEVHGELKHHFRSEKGKFKQAFPNPT